MKRLALALLLLPPIVACTPSASSPRSAPIPPTAVAVDSLVRHGETHFAHLWQITFGGENAEAYWSADGRKLTMQSTHGDWPCDQIYTVDLENGRTRRVSTGLGRTTCSYFYDHDHRILFSSTHLAGDSCPTPPDYSQGYVWPISKGYDIFTVRTDGSDLQRLTETPGYDAEGTVSRDGRWIVFTSVRDGDLDIYKMRTNGRDVTRLTDELGYDGGPFFSPDGEWICYRANHPSLPGEQSDYENLLEQGLIRPGKLDLWIMRQDGLDKRKLTDLPGASFAPYFTPDGQKLIYSSNWENPKGRNFDLYLVDLVGGTPAAVTRDSTFDGFPMFSPNGRYLAFSSNRGAKVHGETNVFIAEWKD